MGNSKSSHHIEPAGNKDIALAALFSQIPRGVSVFVEFHYLGSEQCGYGDLQAEWMSHSPNRKLSNPLTVLRLSGSIMLSVRKEVRTRDSGRVVRRCRRSRSRPIYEVNSEEWSDKWYTKKRKIQGKNKMRQKMGHWENRCVRGPTWRSLTRVGLRESISFLGGRFTFHSNEGYSFFTWALRQGN